MSSSKSNTLVPLLCLVLQGVFVKELFPQSVYESTDVATLDDSFIISKISVLDLTNYDFALSGDSVTWDYSSFTPVSQERKRFTNPDRTGFRTTYLFTCNNLCYNNCYNDCVRSGGFPLVCAGTCNFSCGSTCLTNWLTKFDLAELTTDSVNLIITTVEDIFNFYDLSGDALSQVAVGARLSGFPIVLEYENPDRVYAFPMQYGNKDTSYSAYSLQLDSIPGTGIAVSFIYNHRQQRYNHIEGWGTLKTPFGVFNNVLKLKSIVNSQDTLILQGDTLPLNLLSQNLIEYKWFSPDYGIPLLKITARVINGTLIYQDLEYIDSLRCFDPFSVFAYQPFPPVISSDEDNVEVSFFSLSVNGDYFRWDFGDTSSSANTASGPDAVHIYSEGGLFTVRLVTCNAACPSPVCDTFSLPVLIIDLRADSVTPVHRLPEMNIAITPNPFHGKLFVHVDCTMNETMNLTVYDLAGKPEFISDSRRFLPGHHRSEFDFHRLPAGVYLAKAETETVSRVFKLIKSSGMRE